MSDDLKKELREIKESIVQLQNQMAHFSNDTAKNFQLLNDKMNITVEAATKKVLGEIEKKK